MKSDNEPECELCQSKLKGVQDRFFIVQRKTSHNSFLEQTFPNQVKNPMTSLRWSLYYTDDGKENEKSFQ